MPQGATFMPPLTNVMGAPQMGQVVPQYSMSNEPYASHVSKRLSFFFFLMCRLDSNF